MAGADQGKELVAARGPLQYDLLGMPHEQFDLLCYRLLRLEYPKIIKPAESSDGGADALLPKEEGGYEHAWQMKHYPKAINWTKCKESFASALDNYSPQGYTFLFPRSLTITEQKTFDKHFRSTKIQIPVDFINGAEIQARLDESDDGRRIAKHFFKDDGDVLEEIKRFAQAGGALEKPEDAMARMKSIGDYLAASDPYFSYAGSVYREGTETKPHEGAVMSVSESDGTVTTRIDVVPDDPEAMELHAPKGTMHFPIEVYEEAKKALARGEEFTAEGIEVTWEQLPPAFGEQVGETREADVTIGPVARRPPAPWDARISVENEGEKARIDVDLRPVDPPAGWESALQGTSDGLTVRIFTRRVGDGGEARVKYSYSFSRDPARAQLEALRFMDLIFKPGGTMQIATRPPSQREVTLQTGAEEDAEPLETLRTFLGWIVEIEDWAGVSIPVGPDDFTQENFESVAQVAAALRRGGFNVKVGEIEFVQGPEAPREIPQGGPLVLRRDLDIELFGRRVPLGVGQIVIEDYEFEKRGTDEQGNRVLALRPGSPEAAETTERISRPQKTKKPPPPPGKKGRSRRGRSRRKGGR
jgi:hypothetical protein